ncbi:MAG: tetratricopeptide repeat protein [Campylobacterota bacterium]
MKWIFFLVTCTYLMSSGFDDREIISKGRISFTYKGNDNYAYILSNNGKYLFDIYQEDGGIMEVKLLLEDENITTILMGTYHNIPSPDIKCEEVSAMWYNIYFYMAYDTFMLKLMIDNQFGYDGNVMCEKEVYPHKTMKSLRTKLNSLKITNKLILDSLEKFINPTYGQKYDSKFTFKDSSFDLATLKEILNDIRLSKKTLTQYNNIAYYLQKAGANEEAIYLLEKILKKFPNRTVAYYNLGDAYWVLGEKEKAVKAYGTYIEQMKAKGKSGKIPKIVLDRFNRK